MKRIIVEVTDGKHTFSEDVTEDVTNYAEHQKREIESKGNDLEKYNRHREDLNSHFIFGWVEVLSQSDNLMNWMTAADVELIFRVKHTE